MKSIVIILGLFSVVAFGQNPIDLSEKLMKKMMEEMKAMDSGLDKMMKNFDDDSFIGKKIAGPEDKIIIPGGNTILSEDVNFSWSENESWRFLTIDILHPDKVKLEVKVDKESVSISSSMREEKKVVGQSESVAQFSSQRVMTVPPDVDGSIARIEHKGEKQILIKFPKNVKGPGSVAPGKDEKNPVPLGAGDKTV